MKKQFILVHIEDGIPTFWTNDPSILIVLHNRDAKGTEFWETYRQNDPVFDKMMMMPETVDGITVSPIEAKQLLDSPAPTEAAGNETQGIDWNAEAAKIGVMREKAIQWLGAVLTPEMNYRVAAERTRYATVGKVMDTGEVVVAWTDEASGIDTGWCSMRDTCNDAEVIRLAGEVQKAIA